MQTATTHAAVAIEQVITSRRIVEGEAGRRCDAGQQSTHLHCETTATTPARWLSCVPTW